MTPHSQIKMYNNLKKFLRGFVYAARGIAYNIKTQRNFRFHIVAAVWVLLLSFFYDFGRTEYALLMVTFSSVMALEAVNTAIESAVDLVTDGERKKLAELAKDAAAGAVLIAAVFAVAVAVFLFWDTAVFCRIGEFLLDYPLSILFAAALAAGSFIFVFKGK